MASYNTPIITTQGQSLLKATIANNDTMTFTKIVFSSDDYSQSTDSNVASLTALSSLDLTATARAFVDVNGNLKIRGVANNQNTTSAFYIKTYGLYVKNSAGTEMLFAVATTQNANFVPAYNGKQTNQIAYTFNIAISSTNNITLSSSTDVSVTQADVANVNSAVNSLANSAASGISSLQSSVASNATSIFTNEVNINNIQASVSTNSQQIADNATAISKVTTLANQAQTAAYQGLRFMGDIPGNTLTNITQSGIFNLAGKRFTDWINDTQIYGQLIVIISGGVISLTVRNNVGNMWIQTVNSWGNSGWKQVA